MEKCKNLVSDYKNFKNLLLQNCSGEFLSRPHTTRSGFPTLRLPDLSIIGDKSGVRSEP